ncbi:MAG: PorP/SprF family type IX secretion system membrane protein [Bacteroidota bacterium]
MKKKLICLFLFICTLAELSAQDLHWSQSSNILLYQNPAFTGINNKFSLNTAYRNQWNAVNTNFKSYIIGGDYRFGKNEQENISLSAGGLAYSYTAGNGNYRIINGGLTFSCLVKATNLFWVGAGFGCNMVQSSLQVNNFTWGSQFDGQAYDPSINQGESFNSASKVAPDLTAGIAGMYNKKQVATVANTTTSFIFGYSINHINRPDISISGTSDRLIIKHVLFGKGNIHLRNNLSLKPSVLVYRQNTLGEITLGTLCRYTIGQTSQITGYRKGTAVSFGLLYRIKDAIIPVAEMEIKNCMFGVSYDINVSRLSPYSSFRGGMEITLRLINFSNYLYKDKQISNSGTQQK